MDFFSKIPIGESILRSVIVQILSVSNRELDLQNRSNKSRHIDLNFIFLEKY